MIKPNKIIIPLSFKPNIALLIVVFLGLLAGVLLKPQTLNKYVARLINQNGQLLAENQKIVFMDADNDGNSEEFVYYNLSNNRKPIVNQYSSQGDFQNFWELDGEVLNKFDFIQGDYNNNGFNELYVFSKDNHCLYLYVIEPFKNNHFLRKKVCVCSFTEPNSSLHLIIHKGDMADLNGDGYKEVIFSVNSRYYQTPRNVFAYDVHNNKVNKSANIGIQLVSGPIVFDIDNDGKSEVFLSTLNNTDQAWPSTDSNTIISSTIVLNHELKPLFCSKAFNTQLSVTSTFPLQTKKGNFIASVTWFLNNDKPGIARIYNTNGKIIRQRHLKLNNFIFDNKRAKYDNICLFCNDGYFYRYNEHLAVIETKNLNDNFNQVAFIDIDDDKHEEIILVKDNVIKIYRQNLKEPVKVKIPGIGSQKVSFAVKHNANKHNILSVQTDNYNFLIRYYKQTWYWWSYVFYFATALLAAGIFLTRQKLVNIQKQKVYNQAKNTMQLQIDLMRKQLDPHFLFNALNSISFSINKDDRKTAYSNLGVFSKLMRESIGSLDEMTRTIEDEISYVKNYFILEKFRFKDMFNYDIMIAPGINRSARIPKMGIFCYVEAALKKGVLPQGKPGTIEITIDTGKNNCTVVSIKDSGLHRNINNTENHTKCMITMHKLFSFYNAINTEHITVTLNDLYNDNMPAGTYVEVHFPSGFNYSADAML